MLSAPSAIVWRAGRALAGLTGRVGGRRGSSPDLMELLPQWLAAANAHGYAAPPQMLPALLDAGMQPLAVERVVHQMTSEFLNDKSLKDRNQWWLTGSLSYSLMRQNASLLPPTIDSGIIPGAGGPIDLANWNTTAALSRPTARAGINLFNAFAQLQYSVSPNLSFDFELRDRSARRMG